MNYVDNLAEANKVLEKSNAILQQTENLQDKNSKNDEAAATENPSTESKEEGSGIFTTDGKELPKIDGGYDIIDPGGSLGNGEFVST